MISKVLFVFGVAASGASARPQTDKGWELHYTNTVGPQSRVCFPTKVETRGTYFLAGPAQFDGGKEGDWKFQAFMDGIGMVNRFELRPKDRPHEMCYTSVWLNSGYYQNYAKNHTEPPRGVLFMDTIPPRKKCFLGMCDYSAPNDNNWVNMIELGGKLAWLSDTPKMVSMDPETLDCNGYTKWADDTPPNPNMPPKPTWLSSTQLAVGGSAHPLIVPGSSNTYVEILVVSPITSMITEWGKYFVDVYMFDASVQGPQNRTRVASVKSDAAQYIHSFGVTPNYFALIFDMKTVGIGPGKAPILSGKMVEHWKGIQVVSKSGKVQVFDDMEPFCHTHIANTFEDASGITMDLGTYTGVPFARLPVTDIQQTLNKTLRDSSGPRGHMRRFHMDFKTGKTTTTKLTDNNRDYDFLKINSAYNGLPYCIYYAVEWFHDDKSFASMAVMKHNICENKKIKWAEADVYVNEPFFIANKNAVAEDDGKIIFTANDGQTGKAIYVILDAKSFKEIERIELPNHLPFTAHGQFLPASAEETLIV